MNKQKTALVDLDAMLHIVANVHFSAGNLDNEFKVKSHVKRFIPNILKNTQCNSAILLFQGNDFQNFRKELCPEYKIHRKTSDAINLWKSAIFDAFLECNAIPLSHIETDDALSLIAEDLGADNVVMVSSDKDMLQIPGHHYNPYKPRLKPEERWKFSTVAEGFKLLWLQVLTGDGTDVSLDLVGIKGVGDAKALKMLDAGNVEEPYSKVIQEQYTKFYGSQEGFKRANLTYKMVKLLTKHNLKYVPEQALKEVKYVLDNFKSWMYEIKDPTDDLFDSFNSSNDVDQLFNS